MWSIWCENDGNGFLIVKLWYDCAIFGLLRHSGKGVKMLTPGYRVMVESWGSETGGMELQGSIWVYGTKIALKSVHWKSK